LESRLLVVLVDPLGRRRFATLLAKAPSVLVMKLDLSAFSLAAGAE
jgi:hypothetical protein